jgi:hypothetical protein
MPHGVQTLLMGEPRNGSPARSVCTQKLGRISKTGQGMPPILE